MDNSYEEVELSNEMLTQEQLEKSIRTYVKNKPKKQKLKKVVQVGDYVSYDAGKWSKEQIDILKDLQLLGGRKKDGFIAPKCESSRNGVFNNGNWKVYNVSWNGVTLINVSETVQYRVCDVLIKALFGFRKNSIVYDTRFWKNYVNKYAVKAEPLIGFESGGNFQLRLRRLHTIINNGLGHALITPMVKLKRNVKTVGKNEHDEWVLVL